MWNPESWALGSVIQLKESRILPTIGIVFITAFILFHQILPCLIRIINFSALFILVQIFRVFKSEAQMYFFTYCLMPSHCCFLPHRFFCLTAALYAVSKFFNAIIYNHLQKNLTEGRGAINGTSSRDRPIKRNPNSEIWNP